MSHKHSSAISTEQDLFLNLLADPTKLKPETKTINIEKIDEESEGSDLMANVRKSGNKSIESFTSSDSSSSSSRSRKSSSSTTSSITESSRPSIRSKHRSRVSSSSHKNVDDYVKTFNRTKDATSEHYIKPKKEEEQA